jgi:hypothetical protein
MLVVLAATRRGPRRRGGWPTSATASKPTTPELPLDLFKVKQDRLVHQLDLVPSRLEALDATYE